MFADLLHSDDRLFTFLQFLMIVKSLILFIIY